MPENIRCASFGCSTRPPSLQQAMFRWLVSLAMDAPVSDVTVFTANRERSGEVSRWARPVRNMRKARLAPGGVLFGELQRELAECLRQDGRHRGRMSKGVSVAGLGRPTSIR